MTFMRAGISGYLAGGVEVNTLLSPIASTSSSWVRNPSWPTLVGPTTSENKIVGLFAVWPNQTNFFSINITTTGGGQYTVNYGDGSSTVNTNSASQLDYTYSYSSAGLANTDAPVTLQQSGNLVLRNSHGYSNGMTVQFYNIVTTTGLTAGQTYYVINATANQFQVSTTIAGSAVTLTNNGSATLLPYKIATVTITPTTGGDSFTAINLCTEHAQSGLIAGYANGWLEIKLNSTSTTVSNINLSGTTSASPSRFLENVEVRHSIGTTAPLPNAPNLRRASITSTNTSNFTSMANMFSGCNRLTDCIITLEGAGKPTDTNNMFNGCYSITTAPLFDTSAVTTMNNMFLNCSSLTDVPLYNTALVQDMGHMFRNCTALTTIPLFNTASVTSMAYMFRSCTALASVPLLNTALVQDMSYMFYNCLSMQTIPLLNTASVTNMSYMFAFCYGLTSVPLLNTGAVTDMTNMFQACTALAEVPLFNTANVLLFTNTFLTCVSLKTVPFFNTASATKMDGMFSGCNTLQSVPCFNTASVTAMNSMFANCNVLQTIPLFNTASVTAMNSMFVNCFVLVSVPLLNTAAVTNVSSMFQNCYALQNLPAFNLGGVSNSTNFTSFVSGSLLYRIQATGAKYTHTIANQCLSSTNLNEYYTGLPTVTGQTLTVTGNYGAAGSTTSIATNKGWSVTT